ARGDHIRFAEQLGAQLTGENRGLRMLNPGVDTLHEAFLPGWTILLDKQGNRFCDETAPYGILDSLMKARDNGGFVVFDDAALRPPPELADRYADAYKQVWPNHAKFKPKHYTAGAMESSKAWRRVRTAVPRATLAASAGTAGANRRRAGGRCTRPVTAGQNT